MIFLKLGGSLITDKGQEATARLQLIERLASEISAARKESRTPLLLGHGSGSFGHPPALRHGTKEGVEGSDGWAGFVEVWRRANALHRIVMDALGEAGVPALSFPPSATMTARAGEVASLSIEPLQAALDRRLVPVVMGDVVLDREIGGTILSTERVFHALIPALKPATVLLAGVEQGVYAQYPPQGDPLPALRRRDLQDITLAGSEFQDVTGGMGDKVKYAFSFLALDPALEVRIFSPHEAGSLRAALEGAPMGTVIQL